MTDSEVGDFGRELARQSTTLASLEDERRETTRDLKTAIDAVKKSMRDVVRAMNTGECDRDVDCEWRADYPNSVVELVRCDSGEVVEARSMLHEEKQLAIDGAFKPEVDEQSVVDEKPRRRAAPGKNS